MSTFDGIPSEAQKPQDPEAREVEGGGLDGLLTRIDRLLAEALHRRVSPSEAPTDGGLHLFPGDDARVTIQHAPTDAPEELTAPQGTPTRATLALPADAMNAVSEAAGLARQHLLPSIPIDVETVRGEFVRLLQQWALVEPASAIDRVNQIASLVQRLREAVRGWEVILPLRNLVLENLDRLEWGRLTIRAPRDVHRESVDRLATAVAQSKHSSEERQVILERLKGVLTYYDEVPSAVATLTILGAEGSIERIALSEADAALNLLRCYLPLISDAEDRSWFGLFGTVTEDQFLVLRLSSDSTSFGVKVLTEGILQSFQVSPEMILYLEENFAFREASQLAALPAQARTPLQTVLVTAGQFLGRAVITPEDWLSVILCANAIELMLQMRPGEPEYNRERRARLVHCVIPNAVEQAHAKSGLESLGALRNQIVHHGPAYVEKHSRYAAEQLTAVLWVGLVRFHLNYQSIDHLLQ